MRNSPLTSLVISSDEEIDLIIKNLDKRPCFAIRGLECAR
jgi:hypothetical protein